jgi:hypothetical protein
VLKRIAYAAGWVIVRHAARSNTGNRFSEYKLSGVDLG